MPAAFDRMVDAIKKSLRKQYPKLSAKKIESKAFAMATASWKKAHGGKAPGREKTKDWRVLEFYVPIEEKFSDGDDFIIKGVAINETTTLNNVKYVAEELVKAAPTFRNVPILLDHRNEVKSIVGRTTERVDWNPTFKRVEFEAKIMDEGIREMIKDGRIGSVSIGAKVQDLVEEEDGSMKAIGIRGLEISLVAVPGDDQANLAQAMQQGLTLKEMAMSDEIDEIDDYKFKKEVEMAEEEEKTEEVPEESTEEVPEEALKEVPEEKEEVAEEKVQKINVKVDTSEISDMKKQISELKELLIEKKKLKEQVEEEKEEESEDETKGEVSTEAEEKLENVSNLIVEAVGRDKFSMYRDYSRENSDTNLKRLVR